MAARGPGTSDMSFESPDSRTSVVGRKRDLQSRDAAAEASYSSDEDERQPKRVKEWHSSPGPPTSDAETAPAEQIFSASPALPQTGNAIPQAPPEEDHADVEMLEDQAIGPESPRQDKAAKSAGTRETITDSGDIRDNGSVLTSVQKDPVNLNTSDGLASSVIPQDEASDARDKTNEEISVLEDEASQADGMELLVSEEAGNGRSKSEQDLSSAPSVPSVIWNKGILAGLRTSFGSKSKQTGKAKRCSQVDSSEAASQSEQLLKQIAPSSESSLSFPNAPPSKVEISGPQPIDVENDSPANDDIANPTESGSENSLQSETPVQPAPFVVLTPSQRRILTKAERAKYLRALKVHEKGGDPRNQTELAMRVAQLGLARGKKLSKKEVDALEPGARMEYDSAQRALQAEKLLLRAEKKLLKAELGEAEKQVQHIPFQQSTEAAAAAIAKFGWPLPESQSQISQSIVSGKTLYPVLRKKDRRMRYMSYATGEIILNELLDASGGPFPVQDFSYNVFAPAFMLQNRGKVDSMSQKALHACFGMYIHTYYTHTGNTSWLKATAVAPGALTLAAAKRTLGLSTIEPVLHQEGKVPQSGSSNGLTSEVQGDLAQAQSTPVIIEELDDAASTIEDAQLSEVDSDDESADSNEVHSITSDQEADPDFVRADLALRQRYYPSSSPAESFCVACARSGHTSLRCPAKHCSTCGQFGKHFKNLCPQNQRCYKCRERGHKTMDCPEKLGRAGTEAIGCDLCGSTDHLENACHYIWRSFEPQPEDIITVRDITVSCYNCGGDGHFGPECGLFRNAPILSGGLTWSKENRQIYMDPTSQKRAVGAGPDYSIPSRPSNSNKMDFAIKGKAGDPIMIDDDSEEESFIRPKVHPNQNPRGGQIQFASSSRAPRGPAHDLPPRPMNPPRQMQIRPEFELPGRSQGFYEEGPRSHFSQPSYPPTGPSQRMGAGPAPGPRGPNRPNQGNNNSRGSSRGSGPERGGKKKGKKSNGNKGPSQQPANPRNPSRGRR